MAYEISLAGKTAVITGSNSGIGLGMAWELARAGANVVLNSFTDTDEANWDAKLPGQRHHHASPGGAIQFGHT